MSDSELTRAGERLVKQIESLGELRNAGPRDQRFKLWRQDTLTLLQRLWPGDHDKAERFRRIPFSAPIARSDRGGMREYFERGCKEAASYLDGLAFELGVGMHGHAMMDAMGDAPPADMDATTEAAVDEPAAEEPAAEEATPPAAPIRKTLSPKVEHTEADQPISFLGRGASLNAAARSPAPPPKKQRQQRPAPQASSQQAQPQAPRAATPPP